MAAPVSAKAGIAFSTISRFLVKSEIKKKLKKIWSGKSANSQRMTVL